VTLVNPTNFKVLFLDEDDEIDETIFKQMFQKFDKDNSGKISKMELKQAIRELNNKVTEEGVEEIVSYGDFDANGQLDYENFVKIVTQ